MFAEEMQSEAYTHIVFTLACPALRRTGMIKALALVVVAALTGYTLHVLAQARADTRAALTPIVSSSSNGVSFAWFYDPAERTVFVCRAGQGGPDTVECKAKTALP